MTPLQDIIRPALARLPETMQGERAEVLLLAIGWQESRFFYRKQISGPARGFWQFERGGVYGVRKHPKSRDLALKLCNQYAANDSEQVTNLLETEDILACQLARLLLWTDPAPLPALGKTQAAWDYYLRNWRPGKPHRDTWDRFYQQAVESVCGETA